MTIAEFINKNIGKKVDYDGYYGAQCVDLFRQYCQDVWGIPRTEPVNGAVELYTKYEKTVVEKKYLEQFKAKSKAQCGDAVVWGKTASNIYGHVAIVVCPRKSDVIVFEQDGFKQNGTKLSIRTYENLAGFLRKKE